MKIINIDRARRLKEEAHLGHNRWHPDIPPVVEVDPGEEVVLETRDASDCQIQPDMTSADLGGLDAKVAHPLTGPVYVKGAEPGDLLEIEYLDIVAQPRGWTRNRPGAGFLRDVFTEPYLVHWNMSDGWATSEQIPGVRIPDGSFMGTAGLAPSHAQLVSWAEREADWGAAWWPGSAARSGGCYTRRRSDRRAGFENVAAPGKLRERRCQAAHEGFEAVHSGGGRWWPVFGRRRPFCPG